MRLRRTTAGGGSSLGSNGPVTFEAESTNYAHAQSDGGAGALGLAVAIDLPEASVEGATVAGIGGAITNASGVTIKSTSHNHAEAHSVVVAVGAIAGTGPK